MHNRLIFLYHRVRAQPEGGRSGAGFGRTRPNPWPGSDGGTQEGRSTGRWLSRSKQVGGPIGKSVGHIPRDAMPIRSGEVTDPMLPRKASSELTRCPYPKPTQVGT